MRLDRFSFRPAARRPAAGLAALTALVAAAACSSDPSTGPSTSTGISARAKAYLDSVLSFEAQVHYWYKNVDTAGQRTTVFATAGAAQTYRDTWTAADTSIDPFLVRAAPSPGDLHSAFFPATEAPGVVNTPGGTDTRYLAQGSTLTLSGSTNAAYLWMPTYDGLNDTGRADSIQTVIRTLDQQAPCGWIIDLRFNPGGTWAAMMAGINPILGDAPYGGGKLGFMGFVDRDGFKEYQFVAGGAAGIAYPAQFGYRGDSSVYARATSNYTLRRPGSPVALLQGGYTASAGEEIVLAFRGVSFPVRTFGANTYGVTTAPFGAYMYQLVPGSDSSLLNITGAIDFDRTGQQWGGQIPPVQAVTGPSPSAVRPATSPTSDPVVQAATQWLQTQTACGGTATALRSEVPAPAFSVAPGGGIVTGRAAATEAPSGEPRRPSRVHLAKEPRNRLRAFVLGGRVR